MMEVAPLAGAWIETLTAQIEIQRQVVVAPLAGAWIETRSGDQPDPRNESHPSRVRGLKQQSGRLWHLYCHVAPLAGAWIETSKGLRKGLPNWSHPSRVRGLKRMAGWVEESKSGGRTPRGCVD